MYHCSQAITHLILTEFDCFLANKHRFSARRKNRIGKAVNHTAAGRESMTYGFWFAHSQPLKRLWQPLKRCPGGGREECIHLSLIALKNRPGLMAE